MPVLTSPTSLDLDARLAGAGGPAESFKRLSASLWQQRYLSTELLELCRLTLARLHRDEVEIAAVNPHLGARALPVARRAAVLSGNSFRSTEFTPAEKAVLAFTECYALDAQSIADEVAEEAKAHLGESGLVFLIEALGCLDARIRAARCLRDLSAVAGGRHGH
ncbi:MAG: hypothetical protein JSR36_02800 [Proteobacteria bacterium]|nr:hypothetical protein [Pseudomonadota bacterium]